MDDELTPEQRFAAEDAETMVPRSLLSGRDPELIIAELVRLDWPIENARALVQRAAEDLRRFHESPESRAKLWREARTEFATGLAITSIGVLVTVFTWVAAIAGATAYFVIAFGAILVGIVIAARGRARWRLYRGNDLQGSEGTERF